MSTRSNTIFMGLFLALGGCSNFHQTSIPLASDQNSRVVERDLTSPPIPPASRVAERSLLTSPQQVPTSMVPLEKSLLKGEILVPEHTPIAAQPLPQVAAAPIKTEKPPQQSTAAKPDTNWHISKDERISHAFERWCAESKNYQLYWDATEVLSDLDFNLHGMPFEEAVDKTINAINRTAALTDMSHLPNRTDKSNVKLHFEFVRDNEPRLLRITEQ